MQIRKKYNQGMSLIETMIALTILTVVITAVTTLMVQISALSNSAKLKSGAVAIAQNSLEQVRGYYQQNGWNSLATYSAPAFSDPVFGRSVNVVQNGSQMAVTVTVTWNDKGKSQNLTTSTYFYSY